MGSPDGSRFLCVSGEHNLNIIITPPPSNLSDQLNPFTEASYNVLKQLWKKIIYSTFTHTTQFVTPCRFAVCTLLKKGRKYVQKLGGGGGANHLSTKKKGDFI